MTPPPSLSDLTFSQWLHLWGWKFFTAWAFAMLCAVWIVIGAFGDQRRREAAERAADGGEGPISRR